MLEAASICRFFCDQNNASGKATNSVGVWLSG